MTSRSLLLGAAVATVVGWSANMRGAAAPTSNSANAASRLGVRIPESPAGTAPTSSPAKPARSALPDTSAPTGLLSPEQLKAMPLSEVESKLPQQHPSAYYLYASRLFSAGRKDDAVVWYYVGELRYRFLLEAVPSRDPSGESGVFSSMHTMVGGMINKYAAADLSRWVTQIDEALAWDAANPNPYTPKEKYPAAYRSVREGGEKLKAMIQADPEKIRAVRAKNGLETK